MRYFAGLTADEAAVALGLSPSTADRRWTFARAWLKRAMQTSSVRPVDARGRGAGTMGDTLFRSHAMPDSSADRDPLDRLAEEFVARFR